MQELGIRAFQEMIRERYFATDSARGVSGTFLWFAEEVGELASALGEAERKNRDDANLNEEFADVFAWLCTLANITGVDLTDAVEAKYLKDGGPAGTKS
ncbi:MAG: MazG nucleotide pyrophosphohydrolase domain-containing protein [Phycisphaerales bacterium]